MAPKTEHGSQPPAEEDEDDMTSVMSSDQRKLLQQAAAKEAETLERDTAKPPPSVDAAPVEIPKAPSVPSIEEKVETKPVAEPAAPAPAPARVASPAARVSRSAQLLEIAPFALLTAAILYELWT